MRRQLLGFLLLVIPAVAIAHGQIHDLVQRLDAMLAADPRNAALYVDRAQLYLEEQHYAEAVADLERAIRLDNSLAEAYYYLGVARLGQGRYPPALEAVERALRHAGAADAGLRGNAFFLQGDIHAATQAWPQAARAYQQGIAALPAPTPDQYLHYADALLRQGEPGYGQAVAVLREAMDRLGPVVTLQNRLLDAYVLQKDWQQAQALLDTMLASGHSQEVLWYRKGELYLAAQQPDKAKWAFQQALLSINALPAHRQNTRHIKAWKQKILQQLEAFRPPPPAR